MGETTTVAVLGTGTMGAPMARNLAAAGHDVRVWNRSRDKAEALAGDRITVAATPGEAAADAEYLLTMLHDADAVAAVAPGALAALPHGAVWLQMSTVGLDGSRRLEAIAAEHGTTYVDAPVLGTKAPAEQAALTVLASGPEHVRAGCERVFDAVAAKIVWLDGDLGGTRLKLVMNSWVIALVEATAEAISLAEGLDLDPRLFLDTIADGPLDSPYAQMKGAMMLDREFPASFPLRGAEKDAGLILEAAREAGVDLAVTQAVRRHLARAVELGHGDEDMAATYHSHRSS